MSYDEPPRFDWAYDDHRPLVGSEFKIVVLRARRHNSESFHIMLMTREGTRISDPYPTLESALSVIHDWEVKHGIITQPDS